MHLKLEKTQNSWQAMLKSPKSSEYEFLVMTKFSKHYHNLCHYLVILLTVTTHRNKANVFLSYFCYI
jgi:predicted metal-dependent HD superfamily phosphohydrolase